jgi:YNFM family putative membrane transporter
VLLVLRRLQGLALAGIQAVAMSYLAEELHRDSLGSAMGLYKVRPAAPMADTR